MKKHFTNKKQSEALLYAGISANSADCTRVFNIEMNAILPFGELCWSYGRLLEMYLLIENDHITFSGAFDISVLLNELLDKVTEDEMLIQKINQHYDGSK